MIGPPSRKFFVGNITLVKIRRPFPAYRDLTASSATLRWPSDVTRPCFCCIPLIYYTLILLLFALSSIRSALYILRFPWLRLLPTHVAYDLDRLGGFLAVHGMIAEMRGPYFDHVFTRDGLDDAVYPRGRRWSCGPPWARRRMRGGILILIAAEK